MLMKDEQSRQILSSLVVCFFARGVYTPQIIVEALKMAGFEFTEDKLNQLGVKILSEKYKFKFREGFNPEKLRIPKRIMDTVSPVGNLDEKFIRDTIKSYMSKVL